MDLPAWGVGVGREGGQVQGSIYNGTTDAERKTELLWLTLLCALLVRGVAVATARGVGCAVVASEYYCWGLCMSARHAAPWMAMMAVSSIVPSAGT